MIKKYVNIILSIIILISGFIVVYISYKYNPEISVIPDLIVLSGLIIASAILVFKSNNL